MDINKYWLTIKKDKKIYSLYNDLFKKEIKMEDFATKEHVKIKIKLGLENEDLINNDDLILILENNFFLDLITQIPSDVRVCIKNMVNVYKLDVYRKYEDYIH